MTTALQTNVNPLVTGANSIAALAGLVMVTPLTQNTQGFQPLQIDTATGKIQPYAKSLLFQYEGEQVFNAKSEITDHFSEDNTSIEDNIALRPEMYKVHGFIGELSDVLPQALQIVQKAANALLDVAGYLPQVSITAYVAYTQALLLYESAASIANSAVSAYSSLGGQIPGSVNNFLNGNNTNFLQTGNAQVGTGIQNKQQAMAQQLYGYWANRTLFNIQTPWFILTNMAIDEIRAVQGENSRMVTDFEVTFKKMRFVSSLVNVPVTQGRASTQRSALANNGSITPSGTSTSFGSSISSFA